MANSNTINEVYGKEMHGQIILKIKSWDPGHLGLRQLRSKQLQGTKVKTKWSQLFSFPKSCWSVFPGYFQWSANKVKIRGQKFTHLFRYLALTRDVSKSHLKESTISKIYRNYRPKPFQLKVV